MKRLEFFGLSVVLCICMAVLELRVGALTPRIIGGETAREEEFPYQAALVKDDQLLAGASLISQNYVLTAAHTVYKPKTTIRYSVSDIKVRAGSINFNSGGVLVDVSEIKVHPSYRRIGPPNYDIALLKLAKPLNFTDKIRAIELAKVAVEPGATITISAWGSVFLDGPVQEMLQHANLKVLTDEDCMETSYTYVHTAFCATQMDKRACYGDSGGPAVYKGTLVGIISFGNENCTTGNSDGFTKISMFHGWIIENSDLE